MLCHRMPVVWLGEDISSSLNGVVQCKLCLVSIYRSDKKNSKCSQIMYYKNIQNFCLCFFEAVRPWLEVVVLLRQTV